jgi:hypothetical protein
MAITRLGGANAITGTLPAANINDTSIGNITALPAGVGGKVLQVSNMSIVSASQTLATDTYTDLTGLSINITPSSTSNKIFLYTSINCLSNVSEGFGIRFIRDSTNVFTTTSSYAEYPNVNSHRTMASFAYLDSPSTTSQITYKVQGSSFSSSSIEFNNSAQSIFYLMEIAG